jgi:dTDP-4-dehydrorhamnose reductase
LTVLVTGATGQLASSLGEAGARRGVNIVAVERPDLDLAEPDTIEAAIGRASPSLVVNTAAYTAVDQAESDAAAAHAVNAEGAGAVAAVCDKLRIPIIHISTDYVFDGCKEGPYVESDPASPISVYGRSKLEGERRVAAACRRHLILRTSWLYSPFGHNFVKTMLRLGGSRPEIAVVDDQVGNPTYAPHLAEAVLEIARRLLAEPHRDHPWGVYHTAGSGSTTWRAFAEAIFGCSRDLGAPSVRVRPISTAEYPTPARRPANSQLDCAKLERAFGIKLPSWKVGTQDCVVRLMRQAAESARAPASLGAER